MIVLDTNVLSELMRATPDGQVMRWLGRQARSSLYTTALNRAEVLYGIQALPHGRRRTALAAAAQAMFDRDFRCADRRGHKCGRDEYCDA